MKTRRLGKTGHHSSIVAFGSFALLKSTESEADNIISQVLEAGINHFDVSPMYGLAETHIGSWIKRNGKSFFLGCKTHERTKDAVWESIKRSLDNLHVDKFDLYQFHAVDDVTTLNTLLEPGGGLEAVLEAKEQGLISNIGITGHVPPTQSIALDRFDFDTVMFPLNRIHAANKRDWNDYQPLLDRATSDDVGVAVIKSIAKGVWGSPTPPHKYNTWYEPFDEKAEIEKSVWFALNQPITSIVSSGDENLLPMIIEAAQNYSRLSESDIQSILAEAKNYEPLEGPKMP